MTRQLYTLASGELLRGEVHVDLVTRMAVSGLRMTVIDYDPERDVYRVLLTGDVLPIDFEVPEGGFPKEAEVRFVHNYAGDGVFVLATETHDAHG